MSPLNDKPRTCVCNTGAIGHIRAVTEHIYAASVKRHLNHSAAVRFAGVAGAVPVTDSDRAA